VNAVPGRASHRHHGRGIDLSLFFFLACENRGRFFRKNKDARGRIEKESLGDLWAAVGRV